MSEQFSSPEQVLIERLRRAPQPPLSALAREAILTRMLDALEHPPAPAPRPKMPHSLIIALVVMTAAALIIAGVVFALSRRNQEPVTPVPPATLTPIPPTASAVPSLALTQTPTTTPSATPSPTPTPATPTDVPTASPASTVTALPAASNSGAGNPSPEAGWHDDGTCAHPPPDWAPANGWRKRCEGQTSPSNKPDTGKPNNGGKPDNKHHG